MAKQLKSLVDKSGGAVGAGKDNIYKYRSIHIYICVYWYIRMYI